MIGTRGFQNVEPLRASPGFSRANAPLALKDNSPLAGQSRRKLRTAVPQRARDPPEPARRTPRSRRELPRTLQDPFAERQHRSHIWHWASGGAASPGEPISTRIDYGTESVVTTHTTSARAQCKSPLSRPSCGIVPADGAMSAIRAREVGP